MSRDTALILLTLAAGVWLGMKLKVFLWQMKRGGRCRPRQQFRKTSKAGLGN